MTPLYVRTKSSCPTFSWSQHQPAKKSKKIPLHVYYHQLLVPRWLIIENHSPKVIPNMSGRGRRAEKRITTTVAYLLWCPRSMVHCAHWGDASCWQQITQQPTMTTMLQGRGMWWCNGARDVTTVTAARDQDELSRQRNTTTNHDDDVAIEMNAALRGWTMRQTGAITSRKRCKSYLLKI